MPSIFIQLVLCPTIERSLVYKGSWSCWSFWLRWISYWKIENRRNVLRPSLSCFNYDTLSLLGWFRLILRPGIPDCDSMLTFRSPVSQICVSSQTDYTDCTMARTVLQRLFFSSFFRFFYPSVTGYFSYSFWIAKFHPFNSAIQKLDLRHLYRHLMKCMFSLIMNFIHFLISLYYASGNYILFVSSSCKHMFTGLCFVYSVEPKHSRKQIIFYFSAYLVQFSRLYLQFFQPENSFFK